MSNETGTKNVVVTRILEAPVDEVWKAWSESHRVMQWWGPNGYTCPVAEMDFREGGKSLVCMRAPAEYGGQDTYNTWTYRRIVPPAEIEFVMNFSDAEGNPLDPTSIGLPAGIPFDVRHVVTFTSLDPETTEMTVTEYGYLTDDVVSLSTAGLDETLDKMEDLFA